MTAPPGGPRRNIPQRTPETSAVVRLGRAPARHTAGRPARTARHHISNEAAPQTDVSASDSPMLLLVGLRRSFVSRKATGYGLRTSGLDRACHVQRAGRARTQRHGTAAGVIGIAQLLRRFVTQQLPR